MTCPKCRSEMYDAGERGFRAWACVCGNRVYPDYCSPECRAEARNAFVIPHAVGQPISPEGENMKEKRLCVICGKEYTAKRKNSRFCSKPCRDKYFGSIRRKVGSSPLRHSREGGGGKPLAPILTLTLDLSAYPNLSGRLRALAEKEFRSPEMQLLKLLHEELERGEAA